MHEKLSVGPEQEMCIQKSPLNTKGSFLIQLTLWDILAGGVVEHENKGKSHYGH